MTTASQLRPFQIDGTRFLLKQRRAILGDEMGVGKTVQALMYARQLTKSRSPRKVLIVAPKSARGEWLDQAAQWIGWRGCDYNGTRRQLDLSADFVITNYSLLNELVEIEPNWTVIIFDEAHKLRNARKRQAKKAADGTKTERGPFRAWLKLRASEGMLFMTGTPVTKNPGDLFPMLNAINPKRWSSYWAFVKRYTYVSHNGFGFKVEGARNEEALQRELDSVMIRRLKAEVMKDLPPKTRSSVKVQMSAKQRKHYRELAKTAMTEIGEPSIPLIAPGVLAKLTRLRQLLVTPRILGIDEDGAALDALVEKLDGADQPALVFTPFREAISHIRAALEAVDIECFEVHGGTRNIGEVVKAFESSDNPRRAIIATAQQGTSWKAITASSTHHLGWLWNPSDNMQCEDRPHRHGQRNAVNNYYYLSEGTIDDDGMDIIAGKKRIADLVLGEALRGS